MLRRFFFHILPIILIIGCFSGDICADWELFTENLCDCEQTIFPEQISLSHTEGKGLGYTQGYTSLDFFLSQHLCGIVPFADLRAHVFNNGKTAFNAGLGMRWLDESFGAVWGVNAFYDTLQGKYRSYHQVGLGFEALGSEWDVYVNGYLPVGHKQTHLYQFSYINFPEEFLVRGTERFAMNGVDAEVGYHIRSFCYLDIYFGAGPYCYWGHSCPTENVWLVKHEKAVGGRLRASASFLDYVSLEGVTTYDNQFRWTGQVTLALTLPFDLTFDCFSSRNGCGCCSKYASLEQRLYQPVLRNEIIVEDRIHRYSNNPEILDPEFQP